MREIDLPSCDGLAHSTSRQARPRVPLGRRGGEARGGAAKSSARDRARHACTALALAILTVIPAVAPARSQPAVDQVEITPQLDHLRSVNGLASSPDGRLLVSCGGREVKLWSPSTGRLLRTLHHESGASSIAFSADGRTLAAADGKTVRLWDPASGRQLRAFTGHGATVHGVALSPDGRLLASVSSDKTVRLWDTASGRQVRLLSGHSEEVLTVAFSPDGKAIVSGGNDKTIRLWEASTGRLLRSVEAYSYVHSLAFSPGGQALAVGVDTGRIEIRDGAGLGEIRVLMHRVNERVWTVRFSPDGRYLASSSSDGTVKLWDAGSGAELRSFPTNTNTPYGVAFAPDGRTIATADHPRPIRIWDTESGREVRALGGRGRDISAVAVSPDGQMLISGGYRELAFWEAASGRLLHLIVDHDDLVQSLATSPDGRLVASASKDSSVIVWDIAARRALHRLKGHDKDVSVVRFSPDGGTILSASHDGTLKLWDAATGRELRTLAGHGKEFVNAAAMSPDGRIIASGSTGGTVKLWDAASGREIRTLKGHRWVVALAFSPDGRTLLTTGWEDRLAIRVWDVASGRQTRAIEPKGGSLRSLAVSPDGRTILAGGHGSIRMYDLASGRELQNLQKGGEAHFSSDGRTLTSVSQDRTLRRWSASGELLATSMLDAERQWLTITPEGFFDASERGAEMLTAVRGIEAFSIDQFYQALYRPDLVREKLAGDPQGKVREAAARLNLDKVVATGSAPGVVISGPARTAAERIEMTATMTDSGGGIGKVEWRVNGVTLGLEARGFDRIGAAQASARPQPSGPLVLKRSLTLAPGENAIEVVAYNDANLIASPPARFAVFREGAARSAKPRLHVLAVGVNDYHDSRLKLSFATVDARALGDGLRKAGGGLYSSVEVTAVLDDGATAANLDKTFTALASKVQPDDVFVFFLAGHGKTIDGRYYFLPHDFRYAGDETIVSRGIGQDQWQAWFARIPARKSLLLYDTCESGSLTGDRVAMRGIERVAALERMTRATGRTTLTASTDDAPALEGYRGHGVFTYALLDALGRADGNGDGLVDVTELANFVDSNVPELSFQAFRQRQFPQMRIVGSNFPVAAKASLLPAGGAVAAPVPTRPTHVVIAPADVFAEAGGRSTTASRLPVGTLVTLVRSEQGWVLVAREGKPIGYVAQQHLVAAQ